MALFKCKMCGGALEINNNETVATCEYCGTQQTLPRLDDDRKANLYDRANHFRRNNEFDKAMGIYEQILNEDSADAEAYWSLVLCRYGIEYVEDPSSHKRMPTVNRAQFTSIFDDDNYKSALQYADGYQRSIYEAEAKAINEIQKGILAISQKEEPFDIFICYKETDSNGRRTPDSVLANDLYHQLTQEGFKVFFARITLEDKLGVAYEPYIFAALNSAKVMVALGTKPAYFNAVWVKNEWSRYLSLIKNGAKKMLIPAYKDMDPYDLPEEFSHLQAQDMSKLGFMQDLIRGIKKIIQANKPVTEVKVTAAQSNAGALLKRAAIFLEDGNTESANEYCEKALDVDPECADAYVIKLLIDLGLNSREELNTYAEPFDGNANYRKAARFGDDALRAEMNGYLDNIRSRNENARLEGIYSRAKHTMDAARTESRYKEAAQLFETISDYLDSSALAQTCLEKAEIVRKDAILANGKAKMCWQIISNYESAIKIFESISGWKDADEQIIACQRKIEEIKVRQEAERSERERKAEIARKEAERIAKRNKKIAIISASVVCAVIAFIIVLNAVIIPNIRYNNAVKLMEAGKDAEAAIAFGQAGDIKDAKAQADRLWDAVTERENVSAGGFHTVGLKADGTVVAVGYNDGRCDVSGWSDVVAISAGTWHTVGLKADGTVVAVGDNAYDQSDVSSWSDVVAISAGRIHTVGLKADGTVVAVGANYDGQCDVSSWKDIIAIAAGNYHTVGLKADGTVVATTYTGSYKYYEGQCNVSAWKDVVAIAAGNYHTVGLKADGTVVAVGANYDGQCDVSSWKDIVAISAGYNYTVGLKANGTVVAVGSNWDGECDVFGWRDIVAISAGTDHTVGLKADGTVVAVGDNEDGQCDVSGWKDIKTD